MVQSHLVLIVRGETPPTDAQKQALGFYLQDGAPYEVLGGEDPFQRTTFIPLPQGIRQTLSWWRGRTLAHLPQPAIILILEGPLSPTLSFTGWLRLIQLHGEQIFILRAQGTSRLESHLSLYGKLVGKVLVAFPLELVMGMGLTLPFLAGTFLLYALHCARRKVGLV